MGRFRAIIFDAGGTLIYPARPVGETYAQFARAHGVKLGAEETTLAFRQALKSSSPRPKGTVPSDGDDRAWWRQVVRASIAHPAFLASPQFETFFEEVYLHYAKPEAWCLFPEVLEVLETLRDYPVDLFVLSNWDARLHAVLDGIGLGEYLPRRFISSELGWEKPDASIFRHVADVLNLPAKSLLSVGDDARNDVEGARKAGWEAVLVDRPRSDLWGAVKAVSGGRKVSRIG
jgi:putative hydrolase of the HAD superfamily